MDGKIWHNKLSELATDREGLENIAAFPVKDTKIAHPR